MDKGGKYLSAICYEMISLKLTVFLIFSTMSSLLHPIHLLRNNFLLAIAQLSTNYPSRGGIYDAYTTIKFIYLEFH